MSATTRNPPVRTGIVMLNMGGPADLDAVEPFLLNLFADRDLMRLPLQDHLGPMIVRRRLAAVRHLYHEIGGGSPILRLTSDQGDRIAAVLDRLRPASAPHRCYAAFRYAPPFADDALRAMARDGATRAVAFSQYPQWSCTTSGSSYKDLHAALERTGLRNAFRWSIIDRWNADSGFITAMAGRIREGLRWYPDATRDAVPLLFSAHSLPRYVIRRGDSYQQEVERSVALVAAELALPNPVIISWQSEVGPLRWLSPSTQETITRLGRSGVKDLLVVPVAFTTDHIETLGELDLEYGRLAASLGMTGYQRAPALNSSELFIAGAARLVAAHLDGAVAHPASYGDRCRGCRDTSCRPTFPSGTRA